jgi:hypothetical protein
MVAGDDSTSGAAKAEPSGRASRPDLNRSSLQDGLEQGRPRRARAPARRHLKVPIAAFGGANKPLTRDASSGTSIGTPTIGCIGVHTGPSCASDDGLSGAPSVRKGSALSPVTERYSSRPAPRLSGGSQASSTRRCMTRAPAIFGVVPRYLSEAPIRLGAGAQPEVARGPSIWRAFDGDGEVAACCRERCTGGRLPATGYREAGGVGAFEGRVGPSLDAVVLGGWSALWRCGGGFADQLEGSLGQVVVGE